MNIMGNTTLSKIIDNIYVVKGYNVDMDKGVTVSLGYFAGKYYVRSGINLIFDYLNDNVWDYTPKVIKVHDIADILGSVKIVDVPHRKRDSVVNRWTGNVLGG